MMNKNRSLKSEILLRLLLPLIFFVLADVALSYFLTLHYVDNAYDRWLLDSAHSLIQEVKVKDNHVAVELPPAALEIFKWDDDDKTYFKIMSKQQGMIAGDKFVPEPLAPDTDWTGPVFFDDDLYGEPVRVVSMLVKLADSGETIFVNVAETTNKRRGMMLDILLADVIPQVILVTFTTLYLLRGLQRGLQPLHALAKQISERSNRDLSPISEQHIFLEVRTLTDTINQLLQRLALAIATQQRFITNAAHQLRTPLAGLKLQAERALREQDVTKMQPALQQIQSSADRMSHLTTQLLVLAKTEPVQGSTDLKWLNLYELAKTACINWLPKAMQKNMELSFESTGQNLQVRGDELLLSELLANLLDNAICYGHESGNIVVSVQANPSPVLVISDDGPGIPEQELDKVVERFYRIPGSPGNGCGLGLAIVKEIADLHHAQLKVSHGENGIGTRVELIFDSSF